MLRRFDDSKRRVVPRWRRFELAAGNGELRALERPRPPDQEHQPIRSSAFKEEWRANSTIQSAAELLFAFPQERKDPDVCAAAKFLMRRDSTATPTLKNFARSVLDEPAVRENGAENGAAPNKRVAMARKCAYGAANDAIAWIDLAHAYASIGNGAKAIHAARVGYNLAPTNRFVLRSITRLYVHEGDCEQALHILRSAEGLRSDPWLLAAEISVTSLGDRTSRHVRLGRGMLEIGKFSQRDLSELAAAIATEELQSGNVRGARKLFGLSLGDPTDNSLAQASWAREHHIKSLTIELRLLERPRTFEANARFAYIAEQWDQCLHFLSRWNKEEPYSAVPAVVGSYIALVHKNAPRDAELIALAGLSANPGHPSLLNQLAIALARQGQLEEAAKYWQAIKTAVPDLAIVKAATAGLLLFRAGMPDRGRELYNVAITAARKHNLKDLACRAELYLAYEEAVANPEQSLTFFNRAAEIPFGRKTAETRSILRQIADVAEGKNLEVPRHRITDDNVKFNLISTYGGNLISPTIYKLGGSGKETKKPPVPRGRDTYSQHLKRPR